MTTKSETQQFEEPERLEREFDRDLKSLELLISLMNVSAQRSFVLAAIAIASTALSATTIAFVPFDIWPIAAMLCFLTAALLALYAGYLSPDIPFFVGHRRTKSIVDESTDVLDRLNECHTFTLQNLKVFVRATLTTRWAIRIFALGVVSNLISIGTYANEHLKPGLNTVIEQGETQ